MKKKEIITLGITIIMLILLATNVQGASTSTFKATLGTSTTTLKPGEEVTVTIAVSDINMGENGINTLEGKIKYDSNVFEEVKSSAIQSLNNWTTTFNDESSTLNGKFLAVNLSSGVKESVKIFTVTFKVKTDLKATTETQIDFEDITSNDGVDLVSVGTKSVKLTINVETTDSDSNTEIPSDNKNETKDNIITDNKNIVSKDNTQSSGILPNTGKSIMIGIALFAVIIAVVILAIKNKSYSDIK